MKLSCPNPQCGQSYHVSDERTGSEVRCPQCGATFRVQASATAIPSAATAAESQGTLPAGSPNHGVKRLGRFEIRQRLGAGAFGEVFRAFDPQLDRDVALKVPRSSVMQNPNVAKRFLIEARATARLTHPNIVPVFDAGQDSGHHYIASAFIKGCTLNDALEEPVGFIESARITMKLAAALAYAHEEGIVHRDVKPANVMLDAKGEPHLMDFGLARLEMGSDVETRDGTVLGTPAYMPPEQAAGEVQKISSASDQYSLGVTFYEMLCGERPFSGPAEVVIYNVINEEPPPPRSIRGNVPRDLETICLKAMAKEGAARYENCEEFAGDLRRWLDDEPIQARRMGPVERFTRWCRRNPEVAGLTVAMFLVFAVGLIATTWQWSRALAETKRADAKAVEAIDQMQRADENAAEALDQKRFADAKAAEALAEKQRADDKAAQSLAEKKRADEKAAEAQRESRRAYRQYYVAQMTLAARDWASGNISLLRGRLDKTRPEQTGGRDLRGFEWHYWRHYSHSELLTLQGHADTVTSVAFSPDGTRIVSGSRDKMLKVWDAATGEVTRTLTGHTSGVSSVAFSPDGTRIVSGSGDGKLKVWDTATGQLTRTLRGHTRWVGSVAFSPDGARIVSGSGAVGKDEIGEVKVWDVNTGEETLTLKGHAYLKGSGRSSGVTSVAFSPDGTRIVSGSLDKMLKVWDANTGAEMLTLQGHADTVTSVAFSPDGTRIVSGSGNGAWKTTGEIKVWDAATGQVTRTLQGHTRDVRSVAFSPDGTRIFSATSTVEIKVWDAAAGEVTLTLKGDNKGGTSVAFSPDGTRVVSGSHNNTLKVWNATTDLATLTLTGHTDNVHSVAFRPGGTRIVSGSADKTLKVWDVATGRETRTHAGHGSWVRSVAVSPDGRRIVSSGAESVKVWDAATGRETLQLKGHNRFVYSVAFSPDGTQVASGSFTSRRGTNRKPGEIKVWDVATGEESLMLTGLVTGHRSPVRSVAFSQDGSRIVSGSEDKTLKVWDATKGRVTLTLKGHTDSVTSVAFSPDGTQIVSGSVDKTLKLWDAATGREMRTLTGHSSSVHSVAFSPNGTRIVSGSDDKTLKLWDVVTGQETLTLTGHSAPVNSVAFSPDGTRIVSGSDDKTLKLWDSGPRPFDD